MTRPLAEWTARVLGSPTAAVEAKVAELRARGITLYCLNAGEPDFPTADHVKAAAIAAVRDDVNGYTETAGTYELRAAIAERIRADLAIAYTPAEIVATAGAKQALFNAIAALCGRSDEVVVPVPYWVSFPSQVELAGATAVPVPSSEAAGYRLSADALARAITPRTRVLILNSPNNPAGSMYGRDELDAIAALARERDLWVISDEVYAAFALTREHRSIATLPGMRERTVIVNAVSKTYGMTGWRLGWLAGPEPVANAVTRLQSHTTSNPSTIAQRAALAALRGPQVEVARHRVEFVERARLTHDALAKVRGLRPFAPEGGFFVWTDISWWCGRELAGRAIVSADDLAAILLEEVQVVVTPGTGFGSDRHLRISFSAARREIEDALSRLTRLLGAV